MVNLHQERLIMLTLPLDLIVYITEIGDLSIKDIFHLTQVNQLLRLKLLHPYFWHNVYNRHLGRVFDTYEIDKLVEPNDYYNECRSYYWKYLEIEKELHDFDEMKNRKIDKYIEKYSFDDNYLPPLLYHLQHEENKWRQDILNCSKFIEFSSSSFLAKLVAGQTFRIGLNKLLDCYKSPENLDSFDEFNFACSLLQKKSYKIINNRRKFFNKIRKVLNHFMTVKHPLPIINDSYCFQNNADYSQYVASLIYSLLLKFKNWTTFDADYIESYNTLTVSSGIKGHHHIITSMIVKVIKEELDKLNIKIHNNEEKDKINLTYSGARIGDSLIWYIFGELHFFTVGDFDRVALERFASSDNSLLSPLSNHGSSDMYKIEDSIIDRLLGKKYLQKIYNPNAFCENYSVLLCKVLFPKLMQESMSKFSLFFISTTDIITRDIKESLRVFLSGENSFYYSFFKHGKLNILPKDFVPGPGFLETDYSPNEYQGNMVMIKRLRIPAVVIGQNPDGVTYKSLCIDSKYSINKSTLFEVMDDISPQDILRFIDCIGPANLSYLRIYGVSFDDGKTPKFLID